MISKFKEAYDNRHLLARKWKREGRKIFGYVYSFVPEEIIYAARIVPVQLTETEEKAAIIKAETFLPEYFCDFVNSSLGQGVDGIYNYLDGIIVPDACVGLRRMADVWEVEVKTPFFYYLSYPSQGYPSLAYEVSRAFLLEEFSRLKKAIEKFRDQEISEGSLRSAIDVYNENRNLLKKVYELRQRDNPPLCCSEISEVFKAGLVLPKEEHNQMVKELLEQVSSQERESVGKVRLMVSAPMVEEVTFSRPNFIKLIEELGAEIVCDDFGIGFRYYWEPVELKPNLLEALVDRYLGGVPVAYKIPAELRAEMLLREALKYGVKGAIFFLPKYCYSSDLQAPYIEEKFNEKGIATLELESAADMSEAPIRTRIQAFLEMLF